MKISKSALMSFIAEEMKEVLPNNVLISEVAKKKERTKTLKLPRLEISEKFGDPKSVQRRDIKRYVRQIEGSTLPEKINSINTFLESCKDPKSGTCETDPAAIIGHLTILNTLTGILEQYSASGAGTLMEAFVAALIGGTQVDTPGKKLEPGEKNITDIKKGGKLYSIKFVSDWGHGGSFRNLFNTLNANDGRDIIYYYIMKGKDGSVSFYEFLMSREKANALWIRDGKDKTIDNPFLDAADAAAFADKYKEKSAGDFSITGTNLEEVAKLDDVSSNYMKKLAKRYFKILDKRITTIFDQLDRLSGNLEKFVMDNDMGSGDKAKGNLEQIKISIEDPTGEKQQ